MRKFLLLSAVALVLARPSTAAVLGFETQEIVFQKAEAPAGATWSSSLTLTSDGLVSPAWEKNVVHEVWLQTGKMPVGAAWRPPRAARIWLSFFGRTEASRPPDVYVRYGVDGVRWSTWYRLAPAGEPKPGAAMTFELHLQLPAVVGERYHELMRAWWKTDPPWASDEDAFCRWLAKNHPAYFESAIPFLGWVQFRIEHRSLDRPVRIGKLKAEFSWGTGGLHTPPKDGKYPEEKKWHFDLSR
jgi:hypothetical protein